MKEFVIYQEESGEWSVKSDKIPGYTARGGTMQEAIGRMKEAMRIYFPCGECKGGE